MDASAEDGVVCEGEDEEEEEDEQEGDVDVISPQEGMSLVDLLCEGQSG